jgi:hypothetical protein
MKNGFRVLDSDLHTMEPDGLWERYLAEPFKRFAPKFVRGRDTAPNQPVIQIGDLAIGEVSKRPHTARAGQDLHRRAFARHPHYETGHARGYDPETHLQAMDIKGIVVSTDYPHSDGFPHAMEEFVALDGVSDRSKAKILWDNCARLYRLTS